MTSEAIDERVAGALELLDQHGARNEQREAWLRRLASDGWSEAGLLAAAQAWARL